MCNEWLGGKGKGGSSAGLSWGLLIHAALLAGDNLLREESLVVLQTLQCAATWALRFLFLRHFRRLVLHFARACEGAVDLSHWVRLLLHDKVKGAGRKKGDARYRAWGGGTNAMRVGS